MTYQNLFEKSRVLSIPSRLGLALALLVALVGAAPLPAAHAATTYTIDVDAVKDSNPGGGCTLREAITVANAGVGPGTEPVTGCTIKGSAGLPPVTYKINLPAYTYTLASTTNEDNNADGDLDIAANVTIVGQGTSKTVIDGGGIDRVFHIDPGGSGSYTVQIGNVTIRDGNAHAGGGIQAPGSNDTLYLSNTIVYANSSPHNGGGIYNGGALHITNSDVYSNTSSAIAASGGGGIYNAPTGKLTITSSDIYSNTLTGSLIYGGGIYNDGTMTFTGGSISTNEARNDGGGGLANGGTASLTDVTVADNMAPDLDGDHDGNGGGIHSWGAITVTNCTISGNQAQDRGGGVYNGSGGTATITGTTVYSNTIPDFGRGGGGIYNNDGTLNIANSTISDNRVGGGAYGGGGIYNTGGAVHIANSAISGNDATGFNSGCGGIYNLASGTVDITASAIVSNTANFDGGGICNATAGSVITVTNSTISGNQTRCNGGGISNHSSTLNLHHVTIANNTANSDDDHYGQGGGIYQSGGTVSLEHTIIAGNTVAVSTTHTAADCDGTITSQGYNLVGAGSGCPSGGTGDQTVAPAAVFSTVLGPLADNGGDTQTHALLSGSPAIDAVPAPSCTLSTDQRGESRPQDGDLDGTVACDIGAYELVPTRIYLPLVLRNH